MKQATPRFRSKHILENQLAASNILYFYPKPWGFMIQFDEHIGLVQPSTKIASKVTQFQTYGRNKISLQLWKQLSSFTSNFLSIVVVLKYPGSPWPLFFNRLLSEAPNILVGVYHYPEGVSPLLKCASV